MMQLWLDGQRIDSIPLLRRFLRESGDEQTLQRRLAELVRKHQSGILSGWLKRQNEAKAQTPLEKQLQPSNLNSLIHSSSLDDDMLPILAELCAAGKTERQNYLELLKEAIPKDLSLDIQQREEKRRLIESQPWYSDLKALFAHVDWDNVATDSDSLDAILLRLANGPQNAQTTIYLCHTGQYYSNYTLFNPSQLKNIRLLGCGNPNVHITSLNRRKALDMQAQSLIFEKFQLFCHGTILTNTANRLINIILK